MFDKKKAESHLRKLITKYRIKIRSYSVSSCGTAWWRTREIKIPKPTSIDRFCVCMHEVKHIMDGDAGKRFEQEFDCDMFALEQAHALGFDTTAWEKRVRWHSLSRIAMAMNRKLKASKIPQRITTYFSDIDFTEWEGRKVFVRKDTKSFDMTILIN